MGLHVCICVYIHMHIVAIYEEVRELREWRSYKFQSRDIQKCWPNAFDVKIIVASNT